MTEEEFEAKENHTPDEFLFVVSKTPDGARIAINPKWYWDQNQCLYDGHTTEMIEKFLPNEFQEEMESQYSYITAFDEETCDITFGDPDEAADILRKIGFQEDPAFTSFMNSCFC
jgi:hypothetical protein